MEKAAFSFDQFRKKALLQQVPRTYKEVFFRILFDDFGAYLVVTNANGAAVEFSYQNYSGAIRNVLRTLEQIQEEQAFVIHWERPADRTYLSAHPYLMEALRHCQPLRDEHDLTLFFADTPGQIRIQIQAGRSANFFDSRLNLVYKGQILENFRIITEHFVLADDQIIEVAPLGGHYAVTGGFQAEVARPDLPLFLSILFSNIEYVDLSWEDYRLVEKSDDKIAATPCIIFEKTDEDNALYMRVGQSLPELDFNALEVFDLYKYAEINDFARTVTVKYIEQSPPEIVLSHIMGKVQKHTPKKNKKEGERVLVDGNLIVIPEESAAGFIHSELPVLMSEYAVFGAEKLKSFKISTKAPKLHYKFDHGIDFFEGSVELEFYGERIGLFEVLQQYRKQRYIQLSDGSHALLNEDYVKKLERLFRKKGEKTVLSFFDMPLVEDLMEEVEKDKVFDRSRSIFEGFNQLDTAQIKVPKLGATLRPYQIQGVKWLKYLHDQNLGGCLADDMGLGKTLQTIAMMSIIYPKEKRPSLIVMPKSLLFNWAREVEKFAPKLRTYTLYGTNRNLEEMRGAHLVFTTYATLRNEIEKLKDESFYYIILDESQHIKNLHSQSSKAAMLLRGKHRLALSGTPIENNLAELYALFHFLNPAMFGTATQFQEDYITPIQKHNDQDAVVHLRRKIYPFVLRRLKRDVLADLPDKIEQTLYVEMGEDQKRFYEQRRQYYAAAIKEQIAEKGILGAQFFVFQALNELRQIASIPDALSDGRIESSKLELLEDQLLDAVANSHKVLVFVNFLAAIESISSRLESAGVGFVSMTGATRDREALVNRFQRDPDCRVFLMTLKTGGVGLNLTAADTIFIFDPWWNVAAENQAIDRAHRIGQTQKVLAFKLIAQGTIEEKILQLQDLKKNLFENVIGADGASLKSLSEDDIKLLLAR